MKKLKQLSGGKKVSFMFGTLCAILVLIGVWLFISLRSIERNSRKELSYVMDEMNLAAAAAQNVGLMQTVIFRHILASDPGEISLHDQTIHEIDKANAEKLAAYQKFVDTEEEGRLYARALQARKKYMELTEQLLALSRINRDVEAGKFAVSKQVPAYEEYQKALKDMASYVENEVRGIAATLEHRIARIRTACDILVIITILIAIGMGFAVTGVARRLREDNRLLQTEVNERKRAEEKLNRTEELYRRAIDGADAVPYSYDYRTRSYLFIGEGIEQLIGYKPEEVKGELWKQITQESIMLGDTAGLEKSEAAERVITGEIRRWHCDMRILRRDGKSRWISDASVQNKDETGQVIGSMGILQDITERKQAEVSALVFSKLAQSLSSAATPDEAARIISEVSDNLLGWDACWVKLCDPHADMMHAVFNADTINGQRVDKLVPREPKPPTELHRRIMNSGAELVLRDSPTAVVPGAVAFGDKSRLSASLMFVPIRYGKQVVGVLSIQSYSAKAYSERDLKMLQTIADQCGGALERIRADEALRKSESQFRLVWDTSADGMRLVNHDGIVLMANDAYCLMVGKTRKQIEGHSVSVIHSPENAEYILRKHREQIDSKAIQLHLEKKVVLWDGRKVWFELSNSPLELPGQPTLLLSIFRDITQRKQAEAELDSAHRQLMDASRQAGMADVSTNVLHNVGNVLNSVNVSSSLIRERMNKSKIANFGRVVALFQEHGDDLPGFFANNPKGKLLPEYLGQLEIYLTNEHLEVLQEIGSLVSNIEHIKEIVTMQQNYAKVSGLRETLQVVDLVEDALRMNAGALEQHDVRVIREYSETPPILIEKHKVLQILVNLMRNAKYACDEAKRPDKQITVRVTNGNGHLSVAIIDNGVGIPPENMTRIFNHGFTTRKDGHGFGLHSGALAAKEIGGSLNAHSDGVGKGAAFILKLPA